MDEAKIMLGEWASFLVMLEVGIYFKFIRVVIRIKDQNSYLYTSANTFFNCSDEGSQFSFIFISSIILLKPS